jgi:hypothetical protein
MTIYYLYIKTHKITGLKYLGKTSEDPFKYKGSGIDWKQHLKEHGTDHITEVIFQTNDWEQFKQVGRYYSQLYHIVTAVDDFGNKIWANRIPETGGGDNPGGEEHYLYNHIEYSFENIKTGEIVIATQNKFCSIYDMSKSNVCLLLQGKRNKVGDWCVLGKNKFPKYMFINDDTNQEVTMTVLDFWKTYNLCKTNVHAMIKRKTRNSSVNGWRVVLKDQTV